MRKMKKYSVDRIEEDKAVCEDELGNIIVLDLSELPEVKEGDVIIASKNGYRVSREGTRARRKKNFDLQQSIFNKEP